MIAAVAGLLVMGLVVGWITTRIAVGIGLRAGAVDGEGVPGQVKRFARPVPNIGGVGIVVGLVVPIIAGAIAMVAGLVPESLVSADLAAGLRSEGAAGLVVLGGLLAMHGLGLWDDRRPLPWLPKLVAMLAVPAAVALFSGSRVLTAIDPHVGGAWLSVALTAIWFAAVMNAMNFMDNMDGLAGGTAAVVAAAICGVAGVQEQWFVAGAAACLCGATLGFLPHNFPRARIFMGDGGSLVLGFALAFLTTRLTYVDSETADPRWDRLLIPFVLLAVPLYDMISVIVVRVGQGKSPFVGDLQHLSHRFEARGLSRPEVAAAVWALTLVAGSGAIIIAMGHPRQSMLVGVQTAVILALLAMVERAMPWRQA